MRLKFLSRFALMGAVLTAPGVQPSAFAQLGARPAEQWEQTLNSPTRVAGLKIPEVVQALKLKPGQVVVDIGAGTGLFSLPFARAVKPGGIVYAEDIDQVLVNDVEARATEEGLINVKPVLGTFTDPMLPVDVDLAFINDVLHHIEDRATFLATLALYLKPEGRIAIIDFLPEQSPHRSDPTMIVSEAQAATWLAPAGLQAVEHVKLYDDRWFVIFAKK